MLVLIHLCTLHRPLPEYGLSWYFCDKYFLKMSDFSTAPLLYLLLYWYGCEYYTFLWIDKFVHFILPTNWLHSILINFFYIFPLHGLFFHCIVLTFEFVLRCLWMLYICLLRYFCVLHNIYSLFLLHLGNHVMNIYWILFLCYCHHTHLPPFKKVDEQLFVWTYHLVATCIETHILFPNFLISHIFIYPLKFFCCFLLLGEILALNIQHSKICNQHHLYTIFEKISSFHDLIFSYTRLQRMKKVV